MWFVPQTTGQDVGFNLTTRIQTNILESKVALLKKKRIFFPQRQHKLIHLQQCKQTNRQTNNLTHTHKHTQMYFTWSVLQHVSLDLFRWSFTRAVGEYFKPTSNLKSHLSTSKLIISLFIYWSPCWYWSKILEDEGLTMTQHNYMK